MEEKEIKRDLANIFIAEEFARLTISIIDTVAAGVAA